MNAFTSQQVKKLDEDIDALQQQAAGSSPGRKEALTAVSETRRRASGDAPALHLRQCLCAFSRTHSADSLRPDQVQPDAESWLCGTTGSEADRRSLPVAGALSVPSFCLARSSAGAAASKLA